MKEKKECFRFDHPNDIAIGYGRVIYEPACAAWILPGGKRTQDRERAQEVAAKINEITRKQGL